MFEMNIESLAALGEGKEAELSAKNQRSEEEIARYVVDESLTDEARARFFLERGLPVQRMTVLRTVYSLYDAADEEASVCTIVDLLTPVVMGEATAAEEREAAAESLRVLTEDKGVSGAVLVKHVLPLLQRVIKDSTQKAVLSETTGAVRYMMVQGMVPSEIVSREIVPLALSLGDVSHTTEQRVACCRLLAGVCKARIMEPDAAAASFLKVLLALCQDTEVDVRRTMAKHLESVAGAMPAARVRDDVIEEVVELMRDEDAAVQARAVRSAVHMHAVLPPGLFKDQLLPQLVQLMMKHVEESPRSDSASKDGVATGAGGSSSGSASTSSLGGGLAGLGLGGGLNLGAIAMPTVAGEETAISPVVRALADVFGPLVVSLVRHGDVDVSEPTDLDALLKFYRFLASHPETSVRILCAQSLPALAHAMPPTVFARNVLPRMLRLAEDGFDSVREAVSRVIYGVACEIGPKRSTDLLRTPFLSLLHDSHERVSGAMVETVYLWLPAFSTDNLAERAGVLNALLTAVFSSPAAAATGACWRRQVRLMRGLLRIPSLYPNSGAIDHVLGLARSMIETASAPARRAAVHVLIWYLRFAPRAATRAAVGEYIETDLRCGESWWRRALFIDAVGAAVWLFSRAFVKAHLLDSLLDLSEDPVPAVRWRAVRALAQLRIWLMSPQDGEAISCIAQRASEAQDDENRQVAVFAKQAYDELARLDRELSGVDDDAATRTAAAAAAQRMLDPSIRGTPDAWCCSSAFLRCPFLPPDVCVRDSDRELIASERSEPVGGHGVAAGATTAWDAGFDETALLPVDAAVFWLSPGAPPNSEEVARAEAESALASQAAAEEEDETRRMMEERRADARARAEREANAPVSQRARVFDKKRKPGSGAAVAAPPTSGALRAGGAGGRAGRVGAGAAAGLRSRRSSGGRGAAPPGTNRVRSLSSSGASGPTVDPLRAGGLQRRTSGAASTRSGGTASSSRLGRRSMSDEERGHGGQPPGERQRSGGGSRGVAVKEETEEISGTLSGSLPLRRSGGKGAGARGRMSLPRVPGASPPPGGKKTVGSRYSRRPPKGSA